MIHRKYKNKVTERGEKTWKLLSQYRRGPVNSYEFIRIETSPGRVDCRYFRAEGENKGVIIVGGIGGDSFGGAVVFRQHLTIEVQRP